VTDGSLEEMEKDFKTPSQEGSDRFQPAIPTVGA
jgi:hypothetical protein